MTDLAGRTLGRYRLETLLGRGGMAEVWRAADTKLARTVAVKVIHASYAEDPQFAERFLREARVVASLEHPNILPVYDFGDEGGIPFLVMPHLAGGTLRDRLHGKPAPFGVAAAWIRQLADALDAAHAAGVLHRDVKPANVLLGKDDRLFLADFGIAKMVETLTGLTATGVVVGTPVYMAPEQAQGQSASPATDRYALAVVAYEILAGRPPFDGDNPLSLMHQHVSTPAPALSTKVSGLPAGLDAVFQKALSKNPAERPPTCRALADAVFAFLPTGFTPAAPGAWGTPASGMTAPTILQPRDAPPPAATPGTTPWEPPFPTALPAQVRPATPAPVRVATPSPSLTSDATILTAGRSRRRHLAWGVAAAAVVLVGLGIAGKAKTGPGRRFFEGECSGERVPGSDGPLRGGPVDVRSGRGDAPSRCIARVPRTRRVSLLLSFLCLPARRGRERREDSRGGREAHRRPREAHEGRRDGSARGAGGGGREGGDSRDAAGAAGTGGRRAWNAPAVALAAVRERLDVAKKPDHRLAQEDFRFALETAERILAAHPKNPDARYLATYARGGLAYVAGNDAAAGALAVEAVEALRRAGKPDHRAAPAAPRAARRRRRPARRAGSSRSPTATRAARRCRSSTPPCATTRATCARGRRGRCSGECAASSPTGRCRARAARALTGSKGARLDTRGAVPYLSGLLSGTSSVVERYLAKVDVASSTLVSRSIVDTGARHPPGPVIWGRTRDLGGAGRRAGAAESQQKNLAILVGGGPAPGIKASSARRRTARSSRAWTSSASATGSSGS